MTGCESGLRPEAVTLCDSNLSSKCWTTRGGLMDRVGMMFAPSGIILGSRRLEDDSINEMKIKVFSALERSPQRRWG